MGDVGDIYEEEECVSLNQKRQSKQMTGVPTDTGLNVAVRERSGVESIVDILAA